MTQAQASPLYGARFPGVDGLRGIAILMVLLGHCLTPYPTSVLSKPLYEVGKWMWLGVDLFFVLSGFLITRILILSAGRPHYLRSFYARRALRILPASYFVMLAVFLLFPWLRPDLAAEDFRRHWPYFFVYVQNWLFMHDPGTGGWDGLHHTWSLAIEEQFYLAWPLVIFLATPRRRELACLVGLAAAVSLKVGLWIGGFDWQTLFPCTLTRADGLLLGAWLAVVLAQGGSRYLTPRTIDAVGIASHVLFAGLFITFLGTVVSSAIVALVTPAAAVMFSYWLYRAFGPRHRFSSALEAPLLGWFARYSYGMYLIHWPVVLAFRDRAYGKAWFEPWVKTGTNWELLFVGACSLAITCAVAVVMFQFLEKPFLDLRKRWQVPPL